MLEEFYQKVYIDIFYQYIILNRDKYNLDAISCSVNIDDEFCKSIRFDASDVYGVVTIWSNAIVEEQIFKKNDDELLFYLHYKIINIAQCKNLFLEFYTYMKQHSFSPTLKFLLCCSGGLTTSYFADQLQQLIHLEKLSFQVDAIGYHQLAKHYTGYDAIYLAPQISYLLPDAIKITNQNIPIYCIDPVIFATQNYKGMLDTLQKNIPS